MENAYGIGITNRYALFIDEDEDGGDPIDILKQAEITADKKIKKVEVSKINVKSGVKKEVGKRDDLSDKENQRNNQRYEGKRVLDARRAQEGPKEERNNRINQEGGPRREVDEEGRGRGRGGGRGGRGMGGRGRDGPARGGRGGKREFERKSGDARTGLKAEDKRGGGGKGNWGTMEDDIKGKESEETGVNTSVDETGAPKGEDDEEKREEGDDQVVKEEEEPRQLTLDEWKALQGKKDQPKFNLRKAGEGSDIDPKWKKAAAYKKEKVQEDEEEDDDENYVYPQRANRQKHLLDIDFHFADQQSGRGGGRGRGRGGRGGRGRGGPRDGGRDGGPREGGRDGGREGGRDGGRDGGREGGRDSEAPPRRGGKGGRDGQQFSLDDQKAFPALG